MSRSTFRFEMIRSELEEIVGQHFVSVDETDKLPSSASSEPCRSALTIIGSSLVPPSCI